VDRGFLLNKFIKLNQRQFTRYDRFSSKTNRKNPTKEKGTGGFEPLIDASLRFLSGGPVWPP